MFIELIHYIIIFINIFINYNPETTTFVFCYIIIILKMQQ